MIKIKHIVYWEQLRHKSFVDLNLSDDEDVDTLIYLMSDQRSAYITFKNLCASQPKWRERGLHDIERDMKYVSQFYTSREDSEKGQESQSLTKPIGELIFCGVHPGWLMEQGVEVLGWLEDELNNHIKRQAEWQRFWTTLQLSPYIDERNKNKPLFEFDWEKGKANKVAEITEEEARMAHAIFGARNNNKTK